ncbi:MAG: ADP-ribosyl-[dinitrogen reductase] hydrolase [Rhodoferax sp.]|jgi:ADP-ribosyl-[dinitrogen reductase] hydrolase
MTHHPQSDRANRARGALLGLAVGDAIGTTVEFMPRGSFAPLTDMVGGGPFNLLPGQWTDDTSMALCLAASLIDHGFDTHDQMQRYALWHDEGYMSSNGRCFDIGNATSDALARFRQSGDPLAGSTRPDSAGNGSIMRLAPVPIYYQDTPEQAIQMSSRQSRTTHQAPECLAACRLFAEVLIRALQGLTKENVLAPAQQGIPMSNALMLIAAGEYKTKPETQIKGSGYVVQSLEAAFWCFWQTDNFKDCVLLAANLGDDADTTAAVAGQLAGAFYGESGIPEPWLQKLAMAAEIGQMAEQLATEKSAQ